MRRTSLKAAFAGLSAVVSLAAAAADPAEGQAIVKARCSGCHSYARLKVLAARKPDDQRAAHLEKFLSFHNLPKPDERAAVIAFLLEYTRPEEKPVETAPPAPDAMGTPQEPAAAPAPMEGGAEQK